MKTVYLAGPICGCDKGEAHDWRVYVAGKLEFYDKDIRGISPLRCEPLVGERYGHGYDDPKFGTARAIGSKNLYDLEQCDMTLAYIPKREEVSVGTIWELGGAAILRKPTILVSDDPRIFNHPCILAGTAWPLDTLDDAVETIVGILGGYTPGGKYV